MGKLPTKGTGKEAKQTPSPNLDGGEPNSKPSLPAQNIRRSSLRQDPPNAYLILSPFCFPDSPLVRSNPSKFFLAGSSPHCKSCKRNGLAARRNHSACVGKLSSFQPVNVLVLVTGIVCSLPPPHLLKRGKLNRNDGAISTRSLRVDWFSLSRVCATVNLVDSKDKL